MTSKRRVDLSALSLPPLQKCNTTNYGCEETCAVRCRLRFPFLIALQPASEPPLHRADDHIAAASPDPSRQGRVPASNRHRCELDSLLGEVIWDKRRRWWDPKILEWGPGPKSGLWVSPVTPLATIDSHLTLLIEGAGKEKELQAALITRPDITEPSGCVLGDDWGDSRNSFEFVLLVHFIPSHTYG